MHKFQMEFSLYMMQNCMSWTREFARAVANSSAATAAHLRRSVWFSPNFPAVINTFAH